MRRSAVATRGRQQTNRHAVAIAVDGFEAANGVRN
jgi:hypothetical protein